MDTDFQMPSSYFEPDPETDEDPDFAWHELPTCETCGGREEIYHPALGTFGGASIGGEWAPCPDCGVAP